MASFSSATINPSRLPSGGLALFDTHCHLDLPQLAPLQQEHWQQAQQAGVKALLIPAVSAAAWPDLLQLRATEPAWQIALGIHPWWAAQHSLQQVIQLADLLEQHRGQISAVGEIGLDFALDSDTFELQQQLFSAQLTLANRLDLPVILHHRKSQVQLLAELKRQRFAAGGILHAFSGSYAQGMAFIEQGFKLGIGGTITYERAEKTRKAVSKLPLAALVLETDAPAMPLSGFQGQTNTPAQLRRVFESLCNLRPEPPEHLATALWQNSLTVLRLSR
ncbi:TatD family hydrolase [Alishewanella jeotgali]|uniref:TatD-related deoxyribonuclease n=1 Tax=Alishewanella jeotgali KCTC 22429 TaxID=1129374 RepID=H3ZBV9_9ALTE|nr:TatD family hydrolase [Alishewanella jeotgali]EHR42423.1 TatD-related deoxyribonuclease [Alishewanella jeotgali KCTC 22429]